MPDPKVRETSPENDAATTASTVGASAGEPADPIAAAYVRLHGLLTVRGRRAELLDELADLADTRPRLRVEAGGVQVLLAHGWYPPVQDRPVFTLANADAFPSHLRPVDRVLGPIEYTDEAASKVEALLRTAEAPAEASPARVYNAYLGGKDGGQLGRSVADAVMAVAPTIGDSARLNRSFVRRAAHWCVAQGISQVVDVGTGLPDPPTLAEVAAGVDVNAVVVGVDNDPLVLAHDRALLHCPVVGGDVRAPARIVRDVAAHIDWSRPVAVVLGAVLHFIADQDDPAGIVAAFTERMAPGSAVVISHAASTGAAPGVCERITEIYRDAGSVVRFRTHEQITALFDTLELVDPGVVQVPNWPRAGGGPMSIPVLGGVGIVPPRR